MSMFEQGVAQPIFPTFVWAHQLKQEIAEPMNARLAATLDRLTQPRPEPLPGSGWQTEQTLHQLPEFAELVEVMNFASSEVMRVMEVEHEGFEITGCWANMSPKGAWHPPHHHPNNYLSGVYYVSTAKGSDLITFHEPRPQIEVVAPRLRRVNQFNCSVHSLPVKPGMLVLFPAWLAHSVPHSTSDELRISISFNVMFSDFAKTIARPKWSGLPLKTEADKATSA